MSGMGGSGSHHHHHHLGSASPTLLNSSNAYPISPGGMLSTHQLPPTPTSLALMGPPSGKVNNNVFIKQINIALKIFYPILLKH